MAVEITWLGQSGLRLRTAAATVLVDPCFTPFSSALHAPPSLDEYGTGVDWLLVTHEHADHLDLDALPALIERSPGLRVVCPAPLRPRISDATDADVLGVRVGQRLDLGEAIHADVVPAIHAVEVEDPYGDGDAGDGAARFVGYVIDAGGVVVYHAGDTIATEQLLTAFGGIRVDVAFLPVNGRDFFRERRGLVGNMGPRDAVELAKAIGAHTLVPAHWDLFAFNGERPGAVADEAAAAGSGIHVTVLARDRPWTVASTSGD